MKHIQPFGARSLARLLSVSLSPPIVHLPLISLSIVPLFVSLLIDQP
jgi:hypothetical protein